MEGANSLFQLAINPRQYSLSMAGSQFGTKKESIPERVNPEKMLTEFMLKSGKGMKTDPENIFQAPVSSCAQNHPK